MCVHVMVDSSRKVVGKTYIKLNNRNKVRPL